MEKLLPSKSSGYWQIIKRSFTLYKVSFKKVIGLSFLLSAIIFIPRFASIALGYDLFVDLPWLSLQRLGILIINLLGLTLVIGIFWRMHCTIRGKHEPLLEDIQIGFKKVISVFIATAIQSAIIITVALLIYSVLWILHTHNLLFASNMFGVLFTVVVFATQLALILYISILFLFLIPLITIENKSIFSSLKRSAMLAWNHWWRVFSVQVTPWLCYIYVLVFVRYVLNVNIHIYFTGSRTLSPWPILLSLAIFSIFIPWVAALLLVQLKDLEIRNKLLPK
jgi:hypothetical protein